MGAWLFWGFVLAVLLGTAAEAQEKFERLGTFIGQGAPLGALVGPGPNSSERLYVAHSYASSMDVVAYEPDTGRYRVWQNPEGGAWAMENGPDGRVYIGTYYNGHILRLDPEAGTLDDLGQAIKGETYVWELSLGPDGKLYGCTNPNAKLLQLDPATGKITDLGRMDATQNYNRHVFATADGWVYCGIGTERGNLVAYHPRTRERRSLIPESERGPGTARILRGPDGHAYGTHGGKRYRLRDGAATPVATLPPKAPRTRLKDGRTARRSQAYPGRELTLFRVGAGPDGKIYGSSYLPEYLLRYDPASGERVNLGLIDGAEAYSLLAAHGKLYIASYPGATLQIYDPAKPFRPGTTRASNPAFHGPVAPKQNRPFDMVLGGDGKVYIACVPAYGYHGGALAWYDPRTGALEHAAAPVKDQSIKALCALPGNLLVCGGSIRGGNGTQPRAKEAALFLWDTAKRRKVFECVPVPGEPDIWNLAAGNDGLVYGTAGQTLFAFDPETRAMVGNTTLPQGPVPLRAGLLTLPDGRVVALAGPSAVFIRFAGGKWHVREFARHDKPLAVGKAVVGDWLYAVADQQQTLVRCRIPKGP